MYLHVLAGLLLIGLSPEHLGLLSSCFLFNWPEFLRRGITGHRVPQITLEKYIILLIRYIYIFGEAPAWPYDLRMKNPLIHLDDAI